MGSDNRKVAFGFTLIELMVVILIVAILASVVIPILRGRIDAAKWSEGKAMIGSIATAIRAYHSEKGLSGVAPTIKGVGNTGLGFVAGDLTGTYFVDGDFSFNVTNMNPLTYTVTATKATLNPTSYRLDQAGNWTNP
ncbi:MAG: type IV pilin protein [Planctomycetota bacterium]